MNDSEFNDPLANFDPIMESSFSVNEPNQPAKESATTPDPSPTASTEADPLGLNDTTDGLDSDDSFFDNDESFDIDESLFEEKESDLGISVSKVQFDEPKSIAANQSYDKNLFKNIKVDVSIELGRSKLSLKKLYELKSGSIVELSRLVGEPLDLVINDQVIARGEVVAVNSNYGIRITHIESLANIA
ncbi:MAG: flagellar motor switch protein FliN [Candidatus Marinamargulisbacteria bacterium]